MQINNLTLLKNLISIPSIFPNERKISHYINLWVRSNVRCQRLLQKVSTGRTNLMFTKGTGKRSVLLSGHMDTVPVASGWNTNPFKTVSKNGRLYGLGAWDMKAGLYIILQTLKKYEPKNFTLKVALSVDEENYSIGAHRIIDSGFCDDASLIIVPEPGFILGDRGITTGRSGRATFVVKIHGISAHGSFHSQGVNAIDEASTFLNEVESIGFATNPELGDTTLFPRMIFSEAGGFSVPDECTLELDTKLVYPDSPEIVLERLIEFSKKLVEIGGLKFVPEITLKGRPTPFCSPYVIDKENRFVKVCENTLSSVVGQVKLIYRDSVADECIFAKRLGVPAITIGPSGNNAHQANEYVEIESVKRLETAYIKILENLENLFI